MGASDVFDNIREHAKVTADERLLLQNHHFKITLSSSSEFLNPEVLQYPFLITLPFAVQTFLLSSFLYWRWPAVLDAVVYALIAAILLFVAVVLLKAEQIMVDRKTRLYLAMMLLVSCGLGHAYGRWVYKEYLGPYYTYADLKVYHNVNPKTDRGSRYPDVGVAYFAPGSTLMRGKNSCLKNDNLYCVAPIVNCAPYGDCSLDTDTNSTDFWAVGKDCCDCPEGEFRCGAWDNPIAHGGLRQLDDFELLEYKLAVKEWEAANDRVSKTPVFFHWELRPKVKSDGMWGLGMYAITCGILGFLGVQILLAVVNDIFGVL